MRTTAVSIPARLRCVLLNYSTAFQKDHLPETCSRLWSHVIFLTGMLLDVVRCAAPLLRKRRHEDVDVDSRRCCGGKTHARSFNRTTGAPYDIAMDKDGNIELGQRLVGHLSGP